MNISTCQVCEVPPYKYAWLFVAVCPVKSDLGGDIFKWFYKFFIPK